jgi:DNA helicase-2/ATP-dependent DNA helicase PcrA
VSASVDLTPAQREAVEHRDGPLLVLAGPGSGKTRVITRRIARLVESGVPPGRILAITFTNKAAGEMAERVGALLPGTRVWVSTFHRFCARLLRERAASVGLRSNFSIYDTADQQQIARAVLNELDVDAVHFPPARVLGRISRAKNDMLTPERFAEAYGGMIGTHWDAVVAKAYPLYQQRLLEANAVDFDDLLLHVVELLAENPELAADLGERFRYILVDEYQDTNMAQYQIVAALAQAHKNLCVTGDPDQSIYGWRGARIENILRFERDFPRAKVVRLEHNFRSTREILRAADSLIVHNVHRKHKELITDNPDGEPVEVLLCDDARQEADIVAERIRAMHDEEDRPWSSFAIFYRTNALSRELEISLSRARIPFQVAAGTAFYDRTEIKDTLAYLRLVHNPNDAVAFRRVVNKPVRGIGKTTTDRLTRWAESQARPLLDAARHADDVSQLTKRSIKPLREFAALIEELADLSAGPVEKLLVRTLERTSYLDLYRGSDDEDDQQRLANVQELLTAARQYDLSSGEDGSLEGFLETASLTSDVDAVDEMAGSVTLMTLHAAKGLEFPVAFIVAVEQNILPHERSLGEDNSRAVEEERRLLFVGITRARERLFLTHTRQREFRGRRMMTIRSEFLEEMMLAETSYAAGPSPRTFDEFPDEDYSQEPPDLDDFPESAEAGQYEDEPSPKRIPPPRPTVPKLMTGADLLADAASLPVAFAIGEQVRHPRYGLGRVIEVGGFGRRRTVTVEFDDDGRTEQFVAAKCPLQPVGRG